MPVLKLVEKWKRRVIKNIKLIQEDITPDCCVIVGGNRIPVHKSILQFNCTLLTAGDVEYIASSDILEIEISPEFDEKPDMVKAIIESFYCGQFDFKEPFELKNVYKFCKMYSVKWLKDEFEKLIIDYVNGDSKYSAPSESEDPAVRFIEIFSFAHSICCDELAEACLGVHFINNKSIEKLINDGLHLDLPVNCVKTLTKSSNISFDEGKLYKLVKTWVNHNTIGRSCFLKELLLNLQFHFMYEQRDIFMDVMNFIVINMINQLETRTAIMGHLTDCCIDKSESKVLRCYGRQMDATLNTVFQTIVSGEVVDDEELTELFKEDYCFLRTNDVCILVKSLLENHWSADWIKENSRVILDSIDCKSTLNAFYTCSLLLDSFVKCPHNLYKIEWKDVAFEIVFFIANLQTFPKDMDVDDDYYMYTWNIDRVFYLESISSPFEHRLLLEIVMLWSLAHPESKECIQILLDLFCFKTIPENYMKSILLPTVKHLLPDVEKLECVHEGDCGSYHYKLLVNNYISKLSIEAIKSIPGKSGSSGQSWFFKSLYVNYPIELLKGNMIIKQYNKLQSYKKQVMFLVYDDRKPFEPVYPCFSFSKNMDDDVSITKLKVFDSNKNDDEIKKIKFMFIEAILNKANN